GHIRRARDTRQIALDLRITFDPVLLILFSFLNRPWLIWDLAAVDNSDARRNRTDSTKGQHRRRGYGTVRTRPYRKRRPRHMRLDVVIGLVERLPDSIEVRTPVFQVRRTVDRRLTFD